MNATPQHGDRFGRLTVLGVVPSKKRENRYRCGCTCGFSNVLVRAIHLNSGRVTACLKCRTAAP